MLLPNPIGTVQLLVNESDATEAGKLLESAAELEPSFEGIVMGCPQCRSPEIGVDPYRALGCAVFLGVTVCFFLSDFLVSPGAAYPWDLVAFLCFAAFLWIWPRPRDYRCKTCGWRGSYKDILKAASDRE